MIEININKLERGLRTERVKVTRGGKTFYRRQRVGQKVKEHEEIFAPESPIMEKLDIIKKLETVFGKEKVTKYQNKISGLSKENLNIEFLEMQKESPLYHRRYIEDWTKRGRERIDGYITQKLGLNEKNSRLYEEKEEESFPNYEISGPFKNDETLMKSILLNQERLRIDYPDGIIPLYRGLGTKDYDDRPNVDVGDKTDVITYNMSSWTEYPEISNMYASLGGKGIVVKVDIPIENILWSTRLEGGCSGRGGPHDTDGFEYVILHGGYQETEIVNKEIYDRPANFDTLYDWMHEKREEERNAGRI